MVTLQVLLLRAGVAVLAGAAHHASRILANAETLHFRGRRSPVYGVHGMVACSQPLA